MTTKISRARGRPRTFQIDQAIETAQRLFHARGYDAVSVGDITEALSISPPSFYAAFGSKAGLYARVLERYQDTAAIPLHSLLRADRSVAECLEDVLAEAARFYAAKQNAAGCLVVEGTRCIDGEAREAARTYNLAAEDVIRNYISKRHPSEADQLTDFVATTMFGLSAKARNGHTLDQLLATARIAGAAIRSLLSD